MRGQGGGYTGVGKRFTKGRGQGQNRQQGTQDQGGPSQGGQQQAGSKRLRPAEEEPEFRQPSFKRACMQHKPPLCIRCGEMRHVGTECWPDHEHLRQLPLPPFLYRERNEPMPRKQ